MEAARRGHRLPIKVVTHVLVREESTNSLKEIRATARKFQIQGLHYTELGRSRTEKTLIDSILEDDFDDSAKYQKYPLDDIMNDIPPRKIITPQRTELLERLKLSIDKVGEAESQN